MQLVDRITPYQPSLLKTRRYTLHVYKELKCWFFYIGDQRYYVGFDLRQNTDLSLFSILSEYNKKIHRNQTQPSSPGLCQNCVFRSDVLTPTCRPLTSSYIHILVDYTLWRQMLSFFRRLPGDCCDTPDEAPFASIIMGGMKLLIHYKHQKCSLWKVR